MSSLTAYQFQTLCDDIYADRNQIYEFNPAVSHPEALLWMVLGSLFSLLSLSDEEIPLVSPPTVANYVDAIRAVVEGHRDGDLDPREILDDLVTRSEATAGTSGTDDD